VTVVVAGHHSIWVSARTACAVRGCTRRAAGETVGHQAFSYLRRVSTTTNTELRVVAAEMVRQANERADVSPPES
jgi:hypothetical protein